MFAFRQLLDFAVLDVEGIELVGGVSVADEVQCLAVVGPAEARAALVELGRVVGLFARFEVHHKDALLVALVAVAFHAFPSHQFAVGRDDGVEVVAHHAFGEVLALAAQDGVLVDVGVGGEGVIPADFLAAAIDEALAVGQPLHLLHSAEGTHGSFPLLALHRVKRSLDFATAEVAHENVAVGVHPMVPVAIHQVVVDAARGLVEVGIDVGHGLFQLHFLGEDDLLAVRRVEETVDVVLFV